MRFGQGIGQFPADLGGCLIIEILRFLDQRTHPVGLAAVAAVRANALHQFGAAALRHDGGAHGLASGRQFVDDRAIQVGVGGHRQCPGDGRCRHHQLVRRKQALAAFLLQFQALIDPETMLFVDNDQRKPREPDALLEQGMGADDDPGVARSDLFENLLTGGTGHRSGEQADLDIQGAQPAGDRLVLLFGQQFGGHHYGGLIAGRSGRKGRRGGNHGLARSHVSLQQPVHG